MTIPKQPEPPPRCSFCGMDRHSVRMLISGIDAYICDECVKLCVEIAENESRA
ncbi:ClpX C4-type zinc finger protein [Acidisarcina polymorpha]|uniref:ClpX C4-type zinc finger protein n=1 Tax=Acidisarcina polymorpha TaxID=2211140 RepID=UPI000DEEBBBE